MNTSLGYSKRTLTDSDVLLSGGGHKPVADFSLKTESIPYIKGPSTDTTAGTWTGSYSGITEYTEGLTILYVPAIEGASTTKLNLNNLGAKTCYVSGTKKLTTHYPVGTPIILTYYNNGWRRADYLGSNTQYYLTLNGTVLGHSGKTNLGTFYAVATSDATAKDQVWMRNADNSAYAWRTLGSNAFNSTSFKPETSIWLPESKQTKQVFTTFLDASTTDLHNQANDEMNLFRFFSSDAAASTYGYPVVDSHSLVFSVDGNKNYIRALNLDVRTNDIYTIAKTNGTWGSWVKLLHTGNWTSVIDGRYLPLSGGTLTGQVTISATSDLYIPNRTNNGTRADYYTASNHIHGGEDNASYLGANILIGTWYGFGIYPTISGLARTLGQNSFWHNARTGNTYTWGDYYKFDGSNYTKVSYEGHTHSYVALSRGVLLYHREAIGTSPNFDNLKDVNGDLVNGFFEIRASAETTGETGTKPFNAFAPALSILNSNTLFQLAGSNTAGWWIRGKQATNVTGSGLEWQRLVTISEDQIFTGIKGFKQAKWVLIGEEHNNITNEYFSSGLLYNNANTAVVSANASIRNALKFRWYDTYWLIGNVRGSSTNSLGFGIALRDNTNNRLIDCFRVAQDQAYMAGNKIWHAGNDGTGSGLDADLLDGVHLAGLEGRSGVMRSWSRGFATSANQYFGNGNVVTIDPTGAGCLSANDTILSLGDLAIRNTQLLFSYDSDGVWYRRITDGPSYGSWKRLAFITDNVASATYATSAGTALVGNKLNVLATISSNNTANYPWRLIAKREEITYNYDDTEAVIVLRQFCNGGKTGIIKIAFRTNLIDTTPSSVSAVWLNRYGFNVDDVKIAVYWVANKSYADVFLKATPWNRMEMHVIGNRSWSFVSSNEGTDGANPVNAYASIEAAATAIHNKAYTNIVTAIDGGMVSQANSAVAANKATLDGNGDTISSTYLKLSGGTLSGNVKIHKSTAVDTYFEAKNNNGSIELLVGSSGNRGVYDGTGGTDGTWVIGTNGTNTWLSKGNVGIGTTSPAAKLHVAGSIRLNNGSGLGLINSSNTVVNGVYLDGTNLIYGMSHSGNTNIYAGNSINFRNTDGSVIKATIDSSGNVGIGTTSPEQKLDVNGYIKTSGIIKTSSGSGYVLTGDGGHKALNNLQVTGTASALNALDVTKTFIYATVSSNQTLGVSAAMTVGQVLTVLVYNSGSSSITVTVPTSDSWKSLDGLSLTIGALKFGEISILCYTATVYMVSAKLQ